MKDFVGRFGREVDGGVGVSDVDDEQDLSGKIAKRVCEKGAAEVLGEGGELYIRREIIEVINGAEINIFD